MSAAISCGTDGGIGGLECGDDGRQKLEGRAGKLVPRARGSPPGLGAGADDVRKGMGMEEDILAEVAELRFEGGRLWRGGRAAAPMDTKARLSILTNERWGRMQIWIGMVPIEEGQNPRANN